MAKEVRPEIPVYIFLGLLESGKTTVIKDFLQSNQFSEADCNLLILCEEGEEELDEILLQTSRTVVEVVENEKDLTTEYMMGLNKKYHPNSVIIEFNGMWSATEFMSVPLPPDWFEFQDIGLVNAETYEVYKKNMKDRFMEVFRYSDVLVFNRCDANTRQQDIRRNARVLNPRGKVYFESEDPNFEEEPPELPFSLDKDPIEIPLDDYGAFMADLQENPDHYQGKRIRTQGYVGAAEMHNKVRQVFGRMAMACCADDMVFMGFKGTGDVYKKLNPKRRERVWGEVTGRVKLATNSEGDLTAMDIDIENFKLVKKPEDTTVYFN